MARSLFEHGGDCDTGRVHQSEEINADLSLPLAWIGVGDQFAVQNPGTIHENVETVELSMCDIN